MPNPLGQIELSKSSLMFFKSSTIVYIEIIDRSGVEINIFHLVEMKFVIKAMGLALKVFIIYFEHLKLNLLYWKMREERTGSPGRRGVVRRGS